MKIVNIYENERKKDALLACERGQNETRSFPYITLLSEAAVASLDTYCTLRINAKYHQETTTGIFGHIIRANGI